MHSEPSFVFFLFIAEGGGITSNNIRTEHQVGEPPALAMLRSYHLTDDNVLCERVLEEAHAGVISGNRPTTDASGAMLFGGIGGSGNDRPSGYYAADYCASGR